jgi:hypothetical protein
MVRTTRFLGRIREPDEDVLQTGSHAAAGTCAAAIPAWAFTGTYGRTPLRTAVRPDGVAIAATSAAST